MRTLKQYENRQMSLKVVKSEEQTEEVLSTRPMTDADYASFKMNELVDIDLRSNNNATPNNAPITKTVSVDLNDTYKPNYSQNEKLFASKKFNTNGQPKLNENLNERKTTVAVDNTIPGLSFNVTVKRS